MKTLTLFRKAILLFSIFGFSSANAESIQKHPRVAELEDSLRQKASTYLKSRFPDQPFLVNFSVDALRRSSAKSIGGESLPFFDSVGEEILDEWDDPNISLQQLQLRTNKIFVEISLSDNISDSESSEVKDSIIQSLHLTPARDEVRIESKNWKGSNNRYMIFLMVFGVAILFLFGLYLINRQSTQKITRAMAEGTKNNQSNISAASMSMNSASNNSDSESNDSESSNKRGLQLSDPIKVREILVKTLEGLEHKKVFPTLRAMILLDDYGQEQMYDLGAILSELNSEIRTKLLSYSTGEWWLNALTKPNTFGMEHLEFLQKTLREPDTGHTAAMEDMLIKVWRLDDKLPEFIRGFNKDIGLAILDQLPKGKAIEAARKAYPGAWADLLDPALEHKILTDEQCNEIAAKAAMIKPLQHSHAFEKHKLEMELREFLFKATPEEEREIYLASKKDSAIHTHRPPFYPVLEANEELLKDFSPRFTPDQWASALFNVSQSERKKIQSHFSEKQNFMFIENLKKLDRTSDKSSVGKAREFLGAAFKKYKMDLETEAVSKMNNVLNMNKEDEQKTAA